MGDVGGGAGPALAQKDAGRSGWCRVGVRLERPQSHAKVDG